MALKEHVAVTLENQSGTSASVELGSIPNEFTNLINELNEGKYQVNCFKKFWIWLTNLVNGNSNVEVDKEAFKKINNKEAFVKAALEHIVLPENADNVAENVKLLLKFCQGVNSKVIVDRFRAIPNVDNKIAILSSIVGKFSAEEMNGDTKNLFVQLLQETLDAVAIAEDKDTDALCGRLENLQKLCDKCKERGIFLESPREMFSPRTRQIEIAASKKLTETLMTYVTNHDLQRKYRDALKTIVLLLHPFCQSDDTEIEGCPIGAQICQMIQLDNDQDNSLGKRLMEYFNCQGDPNQFKGKISSIQQILSNSDVNARQRKADFIQFLRDNPNIREAFQRMKSDFPPNSEFLPFEIFAYIFIYYDGGSPFYNFLDESLQEANEN
ncbi:MAG: hypothetical protein LBB17_03290 [Puniceicoccales bacterium]|nr:hypothetical protein [Puniceicoccales bacterium]